MKKFEDGIIKMFEIFEINVQNINSIKKLFSRKIFPFAIYYKYGAYVKKKVQNNNCKCNNYEI